MQEHRLVSLSASADFLEARSETFELDARARLVLNVLDILPSGADDRRPGLEATHRLDADVHLLLWPLAPAELVPLVIVTTSTETPLVDQWCELRVDELVDHSDRCLHALFDPAGDVQVHRRVLISGHALVGIILTAHVDRRARLFPDVVERGILENEVPVSEVINLDVLEVEAVLVHSLISG